MSNFDLNQLTEGIRKRNLGGQNKQLVEKWSRTGLLRGLSGVNRENMARMLESQAGQALKESSSLSTGGGSMVSSGDIRGFTSIAFPIVRRVFGGLIANELVSIQPMSLPSGLLFYLDYTYGTNVGNAMDGAGGAAGDGGQPYDAGSSIYSPPIGRGVRSGSLGIGGQYDLAGAGYSRARGTKAVADVLQLLNCFSHRGGALTAQANDSSNLSAHATGADGKLLQFDPQITRLIEDSGDGFFFMVLPIKTGADGNAAGLDNAVCVDGDFDRSMVKEVAIVEDNGQNVTLTKPGATIQQGTGVLNVRRLNQLVSVTRDTNVITSVTPDPLGGEHILFVMRGTSGAARLLNADAAKFTVNYIKGASLNTGAAGDTLVIPSFESDFSAAGSPVIPEIDIKIEAVAVVAETRKLRAKWSPELAQDLNAYHSLDAEVELTQILSEQIALEIDREILNDLLMQGNAANYYWSRAPGKFVNKETGAEAVASSSLAGGPSFRGTVREWYETLVETIIDVGNQIHRKTLRGAANFIVVGPDVATILEASVFYKPSYTLDGDGQVGGMVIGADKVGTLSNRFTVFKDPYFPRNKVLVGYKGGSYLETGYVYAPYVPLIVTPTIFQPEDFTPRKGVMTRYGKKMVRSDFYGTVTCLDMAVI